MGYAELIAQEAMTLPIQRQAEILDFIAFLKTRDSSPTRVSTNSLSTVDEIVAFFHSFKVNVDRFKFDRDEANAR